jgi:hypothetical protein
VECVAAASALSRERRSGCRSTRAIGGHLTLAVKSSGVEANGRMWLKCIDLLRDAAAAWVLRALHSSCEATAVPCARAARSTSLASCARILSQ